MGDFFKNRIILLLLLLLLAIIFLFVYNSFSDRQAADDPTTSAVVYPDESTARLFCTDDCRGHGQCGDLADGTEVVLTNQTVPATQNHTFTILSGNEVTIKRSTEEQTVGVFNTELRETTLFYQIDWGGVSTWVAGWCVVDPV